MQRTIIEPLSANNRSRIANGTELLPDVDSRGVWARTVRAFIADSVADRGGAVSTAEQAIIRRAAVLEYELMQLEQRFAQAGQADAKDLDLYSRASGNQRRLLEAIGLKRKPKDVTANVRAHLETKTPPRPSEDGGTSGNGRAA